MKKSSNALTRTKEMEKNTRDSLDKMKEIVNNKNVEIRDSVRDLLAKQGAMLKEEDEEEGDDEEEIVEVEE